VLRACPVLTNVSRLALQTFLESASSSPATVVHYEFMQDFRIIPPYDAARKRCRSSASTRPILKDVLWVAAQLLSCFDYAMRADSGFVG